MKTVQTTLNAFAVTALFSMLSISALAAGSVDEIISCDTTPVAMKVQEEAFSPMTTAEGQLTVCHYQSGKSTKSFQLTASVKLNLKAYAYLVSHQGKALSFGLAKPENGSHLATSKGSELAEILLSGKAVKVEIQSAGGWSRHQALISIQ